MRTEVERARPARATFRLGCSDVIVPVTDDGVARVRLQREATDLGLYMGSPLLQEDCRFLDGTMTRTTIRRGEPVRERIDMTVAAAVPVRTRDVTDFGRLEVAALALIRQLQQYGPGNPPSAEQREALMRGYQGILEWRRKARERLTAAEGQVDVAETLIRAMLAL